MKGCLPFVVGVVYLAIKIRSVKRYIRVFCQQMGMNFNLVHGCVQLHQKSNREKESPSWSKFSDDDEEDNQVIDGEEDGAGQPNIHHQPPTILMTSEANKEIAKQKLENPRQFTGLSMPKFPDPIQI
nr:hypothetical protein CFP56_65698 [Quercus suber]